MGLWDPDGSVVIVTMVMVIVVVSVRNGGCFGNTFQMAIHSWLVNGGDPKYLHPLE